MIYFAPFLISTAGTVPFHIVCLRAGWYLSPFIPFPAADMHVTLPHARGGKYFDRNPLGSSIQYPTASIARQFLAVGVRPFGFDDLNVSIHQPHDSRFYSSNQPGNNYNGSSL